MAPYSPIVIPYHIFFYNYTANNPMFSLPETLTPYPIDTSTPQSPTL